MSDPKPRRVTEEEAQEFAANKLLSACDQVEVSKEAAREFVSQIMGEQQWLAKKARNEAANRGPAAPKNNANNRGSE